MKRWIHSSVDSKMFPNSIEIEVYPDKWITYNKQYEHEDGGCYYNTDESSDPITSTFVSLYPDGHLTFLWNGKESDWNKEWRPAQKQKVSASGSIKSIVNKMSAKELNDYIEEHGLSQEYNDRLANLPWGASSYDRAKVRRQLVELDMKTDKFI